MVVFSPCLGEREAVGENGEPCMNASIGENGDAGENEHFQNYCPTWGARTAFWAGIFLTLAGAAAVGVDGPLAQWLQAPKASPAPTHSPMVGKASSDSPAESLRSRIPGDLKRLVTWSEGFGHAVGVLLVGFLIYQLAPGNRRRLVRAFCMALGSGLVADGMKLLVGRIRPRAFDLGQPILESFSGFLPGLAGGSAGQSFPSAHTATAVGWALALGWLYPRGRWTFVFLAFLVLCQRVESNAHFLSDTLVGAAVGCWVGGLFLPGGWLSRAFDRWENAAIRTPSAATTCQPPSQ